jgi:putative ABC transport system ATP-binding protein
MRKRLILRGLEKRWESEDRVFELAVGAVEIGAGEAWAVTGPNGCGKSTFLELAGLATRPDAARRFVLETGDERIDLDALWEFGRLDRLAALRGRHFGYVLQTGALLPFLSVRDNIALGQRLAGRPDATRLHGLMEHLDLLPLAGAQPAQLSLGQRQRAAVARALAHAPSFVFADEPTASLDPENAELVLRLMLELVRDQGAALVVVSHDEALLDRLDLPRLPLAAASHPSADKARWHTTICPEAA